MADIKKKIRWSSRKLFVMQEGVILATLIPIGFAKLGVPTDITMTVLIIVGSCVGAYIGFNVLEKKVSGE
jgi:hypothetical protein